MTDAYRNLGQQNPAADTLTDLMQASVGKSVVVSVMKICNTNATPQTFRVAHAIEGVADDPSQYLYYNQVIEANETFEVLRGITLGAGDIIRVQSNILGIVFNIYGAEITP